MADPQFRRLGYRAADGAYGTSGYGTAPYGGRYYTPDDLPGYHIGSDDLTESLHKTSHSIQHRRHGAIVGSRVWTTLRRWVIKINTMTEAEAKDLRDYFEDRQFYFQPTGSCESTITVHWVENEFRPVYIAPNQYRLTFTIEEEG